jgi:hypothetical protein
MAASLGRRLSRSTHRPAVESRRRYGHDINNCSFRRTFRYTGGLARTHAFSRNLVKDARRGAAVAGLVIGALLVAEVVVFTAFVLFVVLMFAMGN